MDNFHVDVTGVGHDMLHLALGLVYKQRQRMCAYREDPEKGLILYWHYDKHHPENKQPFLSPLDLSLCTTMVESWLANQNYGRQPDHDGDNEKGWRLYNESWAMVGNEHSAACAIQPRWAMYGK